MAIIKHQPTIQIHVLQSPQLNPQIRLDGAIISKFGCLDSDGDSFDDLSDEFPDDQTEWFDADGTPLAQIRL